MNMILELRVPFIDDGEASEFQKYLNDRECPAHITNVASFNEEMNFTATFGEYSMFLDELDTADSLDLQYKNALSHARAWLSSYKTWIQKIYSRYEVGKVYSIKNDILVDLCFTSVHCDCCDDKENLYPKIVTTVALLKSLRKNGCAKFDEVEDSFVLIEKKPVEEHVLTSTGENDFGLLHPEDVRNSKIKVSVNTYIQNHYVVIVEPKYLTLSIDDIFEYLSETVSLSMPIDELHQNVESVQLFVQRIIDMDLDGKISLLGIQEELAQPTDDVPFSYSISLSCLQEAINELKTIGLLLPH